MYGLPVSAPTCKELRSHHFCLKQEKVEQLENQWVFLKPSESWRKLYTSEAPHKERMNSGEIISLIFLILNWSKRNVHSSMTT